MSKATSSTVTVGSYGNILKIEESSGRLGFSVAVGNAFVPVMSVFSDERFNFGPSVSPPSTYTRIEGNLHITGNLRKQGSPVSVSPVHSGFILLWSGSVATIPTGWSLCNGLNGTPDLRTRFVQVSGIQNPSVGVVAGSSNARSTDSAGAHASHTLTSISDVSHTHTPSSISTDGHTHTVSGGLSRAAHTHTLSSISSVTISTLTLASHNHRPSPIVYGIDISVTTGSANRRSGSFATSEQVFTGGSSGHTHGNATSSSSGAHTHFATIGAGDVHSHTFSTPADETHTHTLSGSVSSAGAHTHTFDVRPPYYALAFIMKD